MREILFRAKAKCDPDRGLQNYLQKRRVDLWAYDRPVCIYHKFAMYLCNTIYGDIDFDALGMLNANYQLDVIGNIYDNPELLSEESECV